MPTKKKFFILQKIVDTGPSVLKDKKLLGSRKTTGIGAEQNSMIFPA
jgi:hypothetical protein